MAGTFTPIGNDPQIEKVSLTSTIPGHYSLSNDPVVVMQAHDLNIAQDGFPPVADQMLFWDRWWEQPMNSHDDWIYRASDLMNFSEVVRGGQLGVNRLELTGPRRGQDVVLSHWIEDLFSTSVVGETGPYQVIFSTHTQLANVLDDATDIPWAEQMGLSISFQMPVLVITQAEDVNSSAFLAELASVKRTEDVQQLYPKPILHPLPPQLEERFRQISDLPYNWNSYGAHPIATEIIEATKRLVGEGIRLGLPVPGVAPASGSAMSVEWETDLGELIVEIEPNTAITYLLTLEADGSEYEGLLEDNSFGAVVSQLMESES